jgi:hypothetical protein
MRRAYRNVLDDLDTTTHEAFPMTHKNRIHYARRGTLTTFAGTKAKANADLDILIDWALQNNAPHIESRFGHVFIIAATCNGWEAYTVWPNDLEHHGYQHRSKTFYGQCDIGPIIQEGRLNAAQNSWSSDCNDDHHIAAADLDKEYEQTLSRWIAFQRNYTNLKSQGKSDAEAFILANGRMN